MLGGGRHQVVRGQGILGIRREGGSLHGHGPDLGCPPEPPTAVRGGQRLLSCRRDQPLLSVKSWRPNGKVRTIRRRGVERAEAQRQRS